MPKFTAATQRLRALASTIGHACTNVTHDGKPGVKISIGGSDIAGKLKRAGTKVERQPDRTWALDDRFSLASLPGDCCCITLIDAPAPAKPAALPCTHETIFALLDPMPRTEWKAAKVSCPYCKRETDGNTYVTMKSCGRSRCTVLAMREFC